LRVVVLGAGVIGVTAAYSLLEDGHEVTVVERCQGAGLATSWGNGAIIHVSSVEPWSAPGVPRELLRMLGQEDAAFLLRPAALPRMWRWGLAFLASCTAARHRANALANLALALESAAALARIREVTGLAYDFAPHSVLKTYATPEAFAGALAAHRALAMHGLVVEPLDRAALVAREPALEPVADKVAGGLFFPQDELGDCHKLTVGLAAWCAARGVVFHYETTVRRIETRRGRVTGVTTDRGAIAADAVVVALATASPALVRPLGLRLPVYPVKGISVTAPRAPWNGAPRHAILDDKRHFALVPIGERLRVAGSAEIAGYDPTPAPRRVEAVLRRVDELFPQFRRCVAAPETVRWAGLRPVTPSGRPLIGPTRVPGLFLDTGHGHTGWTMAAGSGRRLADAVAGRGPATAPVA
jgi:D-amino-acid dehydrogenase